MELFVTKGNGERVLFEEEKLKQALAFSGATLLEQSKIVTEIKLKIVNGESTRKIYQLALKLLKRESKGLAGRYKLKNAIMELGPTGFPFEAFVGKIFESMGYQVETGVIVQGKCVQHEVDVVARKNNEIIILECKFHATNSTKSGVQVPLYINSRYHDIKAAWEKENDPNLKYRGGVITNTRFSDDAIKYGNCAGLMMISWDYPTNTGLKYWIDKTGLHPITSLSLLGKKEKQFLLEKNIVLCSQVAENTLLLEELGLTKTEITKVVKEAKEIAN